MSGSSYEPGRSARTYASIALLALSGSLAACGPAAPPAQQPVPRPKPQKMGLESQLGAGPMARVPSGTYGPHVVLTTTGPVVAWAEPLEDGVSWHTMVRGTDRRLRLGPDLAETPGTLSFFKLDRAKAGAVLASVVRRDGLETLAVALVGEKGASLPRELSAEEGEILWVAGVPDAQSARVLWARRRGAGAEISMAALDALGAVRAREVLRTQGVGWQLGYGAAGTWLASLEGSSHKATLMLTRLDAAAGERRSIELAKGLEGADQLDVSVGDRTVLVTLRESGASGARLLMAEVDAVGSIVVSLSPIAGPRGAQSLLRLLPGSRSKRPWLAWEEAALDGAAWRRVLLARLGSAGAPSPEAWLDVHDASSLLPSLAETDGTLVALTREAACTGPDCTANESGLSLVALGADASGAPLVGRIPGLPEALDRGSLCWDLDCLGSVCALLCAETGTPTSVHFVSIEPGKALALSGIRPGAEGANPSALHGLSGAPRMLRRDVIATMAELSDVALAQGESKTLLSWVTDFDPTLRPHVSKGPAPDGRLEPYQAELHALCLEPGTPAGAPPRVTQDTTVSRRARSLGGVALSAERSGRRVLGWAALDQGRAHVFVTSLDPQGRKIKQRMLSRNSGEVTDVQVLATATGFLVLWVDDRSGPGQVYAQAIDEQLNPVGLERALTTQARAPVGLAALLRRNEVILTFADGDGDRSGSIFVMSVDAATLEPKVRPRVLSHGQSSASVSGGSATVEGRSGHAHSPLLFVGPQGDLGVAFVERQGTGEGQATSDLLALRLGDDLRITGAPVQLMPAVEVASFAMDCDPTGCRAVAVSPGSRRAEVWGASSADGAFWRSEFLLSLDGDAQLLPAPVLAGQGAYVAAPSSEGAFTLERVTVDFGLAPPTR